MEKNRKKEENNVAEKDHKNNEAIYDLGTNISNGYLLMIFGPCSSLTNIFLIEL